MKGIKCCIKKDIREVLRTGKLILFILMAVGVGIMIMGFTIIFTNIPDALTQELQDFDISSLESMMSTLYPKIVRENMAVFAYYIGFFYSLVMILVCHNILPKERKKGKWVLPKEQGYTVRDIVTGKVLVYGSFAGISVFVCYMIYYFIACTFMTRNMTLGNAFICALIHGLNICFILDYTMLMSVWFKNGIVAAISMIGTVLFAPDILSYLPFGKYLPTYMLTFVYESLDTYSELIIPLIVNVICLVITYLIAIKRADRFLSR